MHRYLFWMACVIHRRFQKFSGRWRLGKYIENNRLLLKTIPSGPKGMGHGVKLFISLDDKFDGQKYFVYGFNLREPLGNLITQCLRQGDAMLDIGANVGYFSAMASLLVGASGRVIAFEASPVTFDRLQIVVQKNPYQNIEANYCAVSNDEGEVEFYIGPESHTGISSLRNLEGKECKMVRVPSITIDSILPQLPTIRLVKIDVEGAEMLVLQGMHALLERDQPYLFIEVTDKFLRNLSSNKYMLVEFLEMRGYKAFRVAQNVTPYEHVNEFQCDVMFVPPGSSPIEFDIARKNFSEYMVLR